MRSYGGIRLGLNPFNRLFDEMHAVTIKAVGISMAIFLVGLLGEYLLSLAGFSSR